MSRLAAAFAARKREGRLLLLAYLTVGYPTPSATLDLVPALLAGGFDAVELGVPFSDPLADGTTIQRASQVALGHGVTLADCLAVTRRLREERGVQAPLLFMGYYNPFLAYGLARFSVEAAAAGLDGVIVPDLPPEEGLALNRACQPREIDVVYLVAPTSTPARLAAVTAAGSGFVYCVSLTGVTGARRTLSDELPQFVGRVRALTALPIAIGFGISRPEHVAHVARIADGAVIGSALIDLLERTPQAEQPAAAHAYAAELRAAAAKRPA